MRLVLVGALAAPGLALAAPRGAVRDGGDGSFGVMLGTDTALDGNPATFRLTLQGEGDLVDGEIVGLAAAIPVTWMTSGSEQFGIDVRQSVLEIPPSLRLRLLTTSVVRPYADVGLGVVVSSTATDGWILEGSDRTAGWMSRSAVGVEIGPPRGLMFLVEPFSVQTYHLDDDTTRLSVMLGAGSRF